MVLDGVLKLYRGYQFSLSHWLIVGLFYLVSSGFGHQNPVLYSAYISSAVLGISLLLLNWSLNQIFNKKLIAIAASVIVFKWALLFYIVYILVQMGFNSLGLGIGFSSIALSSLIWAVLQTSEMED